MLKNKIHFLEEVNPERQVVFSEKNFKFNVCSYLQKVFVSYGFSDLHSLSSTAFYKIINDLAFQTIHGTARDTSEKAKEEALLQLEALAIYYYNPFKITREYHYWHSFVDVDDVTQIILISLFRALNAYDWERSGKSSFAAYMKAWITGELKSEKKRSLPYKLPALAENLNLDQVFSINEFLENDETSEREVFIGTDEAFEEIEKSVMKEKLIEELRSMPDNIGEILIFSFALEDNAVDKHSVEETAKKFHLTPKQIRIRQKKAMELFKKHNPAFYDDYLAA